MPAVSPTAPQRPTKPMIDVAERHFRDGVKFTEEGNHEAARVCFESGYKLSGEPDFLHNLLDRRASGAAFPTPSATPSDIRGQTERGQRRENATADRAAAVTAFWPLPQPEAPGQRPNLPPSRNRRKTQPAPRQARPDPAKHGRCPRRDRPLAGGGGASAGRGWTARGASATGQQAPHRA